MFNLRVILVFSFLIIVTSLSLAQVDTAWVRRYNGLGNSFDDAKALAVDGGGNVYVTGYSEGAGSNPDYATIKYSSFGDTLWVRRYNGPGNSLDAATSLGVDGGGNVYVTGQSAGSGTSDDYATIKYNSLGDTLWVRRYNGPGNGGDTATALAVDGSGNVYVTGYSKGLGSTDYATIKYSSSGDTLWVRRYGGPGNGPDPANALAIDDSGNAYVTGSSWSGASYDYATIKYSPSGDTLWVKRYDGPAIAGDVARALAVDDSGNVYVSGYSSGGGSSDDYATIKYAPNGDTLWVRQYNGPGNSFDAAYDLAVDDSGNIYVTGRSSGSGSFLDFATIRYESNGDTAWVKRYNGPGNSNDYVYALAVDGSGNVYVAGGSEGSGSSRDYATIKYSSCSAKPGDANASGTYSLGDAISTVNYIFNKPGCSPTPLCWLSNLPCRGDWDGSASVTLSDVIRAVNFIFSKPGGPWNAVPVGVCCL